LSLSKYLLRRDGEGVVAIQIGEVLQLMDIIADAKIDLAALPSANPGLSARIYAYFDDHYRELADRLGPRSSLASLSPRSQVLTCSRPNFMVESRNDHGAQKRRLPQDIVNCSDPRLRCIGRDVNALLTLGFKLEIMADLIGGATILSPRAITSWSYLVRTHRVPI
jgi:hypothetical protein